MKAADIKIGRTYLVRSGRKEIVVRVIRVGGQAAHRDQYAPRRAWIVKPVDDDNAVVLTIKSPAAFLRAT